MKRIITFLAIILLFSLSNAQVGIGTTTPNAALDVASTTDGLLIPRVSLTATNIATVITPTTSELVYNTNTSAVGPNQVTPGFYYWDGTLWVRIATGNSNDWSLIGNTGTNPAINYLGTTDANDLILKTNAVDRVHIDTNGNVGVNEVTPDSKVDVVNADLTGSSVEVTHSNTNNISSAIFIKNSGTNRALHAQNLAANSNVHVARFLQMGNGGAANGVLIEMNNTTPTGTTGLLIDQNGAGYGGYVLMPNSNASSGLVVDHLGSGDGLQVLQGGTGDGIYNDVTGGLGVLNVIRNNNIGVGTLLTTAGGTGEYIDLGVQNGTGVNVIGVNNVTTPTAGGNVFSFFTNIRTNTPTSAGTVYGAALGANQYGVGHGILINHSGSQGRNAEFNITNTNNPDPAIFAVHSGPGSAILAQNQDNTIAGTISVGDFAYTGADVADHIGVRGSSTPTAGWGIGVYGQGGWYGVFSNGNFGATGTKTFLIDHPLDPENKSLKHFGMESNEVLNMYRGNAVFDKNGIAIVQLPEYFNTINIDFSYQLTPIGAPMPNLYVSQKINNNGVFQISGGEAEKEVSWSVYAKRNDKYIQENPEETKSEIEKTGDRKGKYWDPASWKQPKEKGVLYMQSSEPQKSSKLEQNSINQEEIEKLRKTKKGKKLRKEASESNVED